MYRFNLISGVLALLLFVTAQSQGWSLFDNSASSGSRSGGSGSAGRIYHK